MHMYDMGVYYFLFVFLFDMIAYEHKIKRFNRKYNIIKINITILEK